MKTVKPVFRIIFSDDKDVALVTDPELKKVLTEKIQKKDFGHIENIEYSKTLYSSIKKLDERRAGQEEFSEIQLSDENYGIWEIWDQTKKIMPPQKECISVWLYNEKNEGKEKKDCKPNLYARNPICDISEDGVVAIDFGTSSTVVACKDRNRVEILRIGAKNLREETHERQYESPTIVEFRDMEPFLTAYNAKEGRPFTDWNDLTTSYSAKNSLTFLSENNQEYGRFFDRLKQWVAEAISDYKIKDGKGRVYSLSNSMDEKSKCIDPIELYAYTIGLAVNSQQRGRIFLKYVLSSPVTFSEALREKIKNSFERGLKKSLPSSLINDNDIIKKFSVIHGQAEPMAYIIGSLPYYKYKHKERFDNSRVVYGVFDFGGGTTDFDYGIWRDANDLEKKNGYNKILEHLGCGGDASLGGENILETLAFTVYEENFDLMREKDYHICLPKGCKKFPGSEIFVDHGSAVHSWSNLKSIAEKLRPLWENSNEKEDIKSSGKIKATLLNSCSEPTMNVELNVNVDKINKIIEEKIEKGINDFFLSMHIALNKVETNEDKPILPNNNTPNEKIHIFLAGNSSRSSVAQEIFKKKIEGKAYELHMPINDIEYDGVGVSAKTGVALGLLRDLDSANVYIDDMCKDDSGEAPFKYYIGLDNGEGLFKPVLLPNSRYGEQKELFSGRRSITLYYTTNVSVLQEGACVFINDPSVYSLNVELDIPDNSNDILIIRISGPNEIECAWRNKARGDSYKVKKFKLKY